MNFMKLLMAISWDYKRGSRISLFVRPDASQQFETREFQLRKPELLFRFIVM